MEYWPSEDSIVREDCLLDKIRLHNLVMTKIQVSKSYVQSSCPFLCFCKGMTDLTDCWFERVKV